MFSSNSYFTSSINLVPSNLAFCKTLPSGQDSQAVQSQRFSLCFSNNFQSIDGLKYIHSVQEVVTKSQIAKSHF